MTQEMAADISLARKAFRNDDSATVASILSRNEQLRARVNEPTGEFGSPAVTLVRSREMLDVLLEAGADINARSDWWAGGFGILDNAEPELARYAIERGAKVDAHAAARLGMWETLESLIVQDPSIVHARGGDGKTPLHCASTVEIAKLLLDSGADIDALDIDHESTPAQYMVHSHPEVAKFLVAEGCKTDLLMAGALGHLELSRAILDQNPESIRMRVSDECFPMINQKSGGTIYQWELGWYVSALQVARKLGHDEVYMLLWERSPSDLRLTTACWNHDQATADLILQQDPNLRSRVPESELRQIAHAARNNDLEAVELMLRAGLPVASKSQHGGTTLHWACWHGNKEMVAAVLPHRPPLEDTSNDYEGTPMEWAIHASTHGWDSLAADYAGTIELLLSAGAKPPKQFTGSDSVNAILQAFQVSNA